jgi:hypothetical protein
VTTVASPGEQPNLGWPPPPPYPPEHYPPSPHHGSPAAPPPQKARRAAKFVVSGLVAVVCFVGAGAIVRAAWPRDVGSAPALAEAAPEATIVFPSAVHGLKRVDRTYDKTIRLLLAKVPEEAHARGAVYARHGDFQAIIIAGAYSMGAVDQEAFLASAKASVASRGLSVRAVDPGPMGGRMQCGTTRDGLMTQCAYVDPSAFGIVQVVGKGSAARATVLAMRAATERKVT